MATEPVLGTEDLRRDLAQVLTRMTTQPGYTVVIGSVAAMWRASASGPGRA